MTPPTSCGGASCNCRRVRSSASTAASRPDPPEGIAPDGVDRVRRDRGPQREAGAEDHRGAAAGVGRNRRRPPPDHAPGEVLREGRTPARDRDLAPVVPQERWSRPRPARQTPRAGPRAELASADDARALRNVARRPQCRLAHQPTAVLRRPVPGLVPRRRRRQLDRSRAPVAAERGRSARRSVDRLPDRFHRDPARPARWLHRRRRRDGHMGYVVAYPADRHRLGRRPRPVRAHVPDEPAAPGSGDHPYVVVRHRRARALEHDALPWTDTDDQRLGPRPRPQEDVEVEGQRRHADAARRRVRRRRAALLGVQRSARVSTPRSTSGS